MDAALLQTYSICNLSLLITHSFFLDKIQLILLQAKSFTYILEITISSKAGAIKRLNQHINRSHFKLTSIIQPAVRLLYHHINI